MKKHYELTPNDLKRDCLDCELEFDTTAELEPHDGVIGQERAVDALEFGLKVRTKGYNIYLAGATGSGKTSYGYNFIKNIAQNQKTPDDWCYVYNFEKPSQPIALNLPAGMAKKFSKDMDEFINIVQNELSKAFDNEDYEKEKQKLINEFQVKRNNLMEKLESDAENLGLKVKTTSTGIYFLPMIEGKTLTEEEYGMLDDEIKYEIESKTSEMQEETIEIIRKIRNVESEAAEKINRWDGKIALFAVGIHINDIKEKYSEYEAVIKHLDCVQENILDNLDDFRDPYQDGEEEVNETPQWIKKNDEHSISKYRVNVIVDNSELMGAPVIIDYNPTYYNLQGRIEYENEMGSMTTGFMKIKGGLFHRANGGYLILQIKDILENPQAWDALKRTLRVKEINMENMKEQLGLIVMTTLKPDPIPLDVKVILVGSSYMYQMLYGHDEQFKKLFKVKADFDDEMDRSPENIKSLAHFIASFCKREGAKPFDKNAVGKIIEYCSRLVEHKERLTSKFNDIVEILSEANAWCEIDGKDVVTEEHVKKAISKKEYRSNKYDIELLKLIEEGTIMIDTEGEKIGQINGLTILDMGDYSFGKPSRITAATYIGEQGIINIEREIEMSGSSHSKGVLILSGYFGQKFAQDKPLTLNASLCFEQLYSGVDGDSASSTELYAILSSLSEVPIKQYIAVTGSVNQNGEIQPIGGATRKIEGYFELCKIRGLTGQQGVIIPYQNIKNLVLKDEVIEAVKEGKFHIYPIKTIDEGIEILTDKEAGSRGRTGKYKNGTIYSKVDEKLKKFSEIVSAGDKN